MGPSKNSKNGKVKDIKVGDLVKAMIITGHPKGIITKIELTQRWGSMYYIHFFEDYTPGNYPKACLCEHQLEVLNESR